MTQDQLASARGHLKNARNQAATVRSVGVHPAREAHVEGKLVESADYIENEINGALEAIESVENADDDGPPGDYYVLTPDHATLGDAHGPMSQIEAFGTRDVLENAVNGTPAKVVRRDRR